MSYTSTRRIGALAQSVDPPQAASFRRGSMLLVASVLAEGAAHPA